MTDKQKGYIEFLARKQGFKSGLSAYGDYAGCERLALFCRIGCHEASDMIDWLKDGATPTEETV